MIIYRRFSLVSICLYLLLCKFGQGEDATISGAVRNETTKAKFMEIGCTNKFSDISVLHSE
jgi:hypothetical protein